MRLPFFLIAGLILLGAMPVAAAQAAQAAQAAASVSSAADRTELAGAVVGGTPAKAEFGAGPASATKLDGRPYFTYQASPGGSLVDHIAIINFAKHSQTLNVYPVDATSGQNGDFAFAPRSAPGDQVATWLKVGTGSSGDVTVAARTTVILPVYLRVPANASPGDHAGAVIVSVTGLVKGSKQHLKLEQRIATRVIIRVSGPLHPRLSIVNMHASYFGHLNPFQPGQVSVTYTVRNTGNAILGGTPTVTVHGLFGSTASATKLVSVPPLLPGGSVTYRTRVTGVPPEIAVTATVRLGPEGLVGDVNPGLHVITASVTLWAFPWLLIAIVIILLLVIIALIWRRRRRPSSPGRADVQQTPQGVKS